MLILALRVEAAAGPRAIYVRPVDRAAYVRVAEAAEVAVEPSQGMPPYGGRQVGQAACKERGQHLVRG